MPIATENSIRMRCRNSSLISSNIMEAKAAVPALADQVLVAQADQTLAD